MQLDSLGGCRSLQSSLPPPWRTCREPGRRQVLTKGSFFDSHFGNSYPKFLESLIFFLPHLVKFLDSFPNLLIALTVFLNFHLRITSDLANFRQGLPEEHRLPKDEEKSFYDDCQQTCLRRIWLRHIWWAVELCIVSRQSSSIVLSLDIHCVTLMYLSIRPQMVALSNHSKNDIFREGINHYIINFITP